ncbi:hypothetical protein PG996_001486 [Apiospora saccharicola]|uniref:Uncharacterized protein n=1 Tax=Apiospora saccharicola TaxID=335842 RepID=A0ABR1WGR9_9PEZI
MISKVTAAVAALAPKVPACKLAAGPDGGKLAGFDLADSVKSTGTVKAWMMFIDFPDAEANGSDPQGLFDSHAGAAEEWYRTSSYGKLSLQISGDTQQVYRMPATTASCHWEGGILSFYLMKYIQDALDAYMQAHNADASIFPEMDILYLIAPPSATFSRSYTYMWEPEVRMPNATGNDTVGTAVAQKAVGFGRDLYDGSNKKGYKALVHETGHTMGMPDYYLTDDSGLPGDLVGGFSVMGAHFEQAPDMFGWDKWRMGWIADSAVHCITEMGSTTHALSPLKKKADGPDSTQIVDVAISGTTMLVAEARTKNGVDDELCGPGVLLYTVDTNVVSGKGPVRILNNLDVDLRWAGAAATSPTSRRCPSRRPGCRP